MLYGCRLQETDGAQLPRLVIDAEFPHDAERAYCEHFGVDPRDVGERGTWRGYFWAERREARAERPDMAV